MGRNFCVRHLVARTQEAAFHSVLSLVYELANMDGEGQQRSRRSGRVSSACGITE